MKAGTKKILFVMLILSAVTLFTYEILILRRVMLSHLFKTSFLVVFCLVCIYKISYGK